MLRSTTNSPPTTSSPTVGSFEQHWLKPAIKVFDRTVVLGLAKRDEDRLNPQPQTQTDDPAQVTGRMAKATELAAVVKLDPLRQA